MLKNLFFLSFILIVKTAHAQYIKFDNGIVFNSFQNSKNLPVLSGNRSGSYSILGGIDFLDKKWFFLSSQIGFTRVGGSETNTNLSGEDRYINESKGNLHLNTTFRVYKNINGNTKNEGHSKVFAGIGPYFNYLLGSTNFESSMYRPFYQYKKTHIGGKAEIGATQDISNLRIGLVASYLLSITPPASSGSLNLNNNAFVGMITVGYRIK